MLCKNCPHCKSIPARPGAMSIRSWCKLSKGSGYSGSALGVYPWANKPHPKCPLITQQKPKYKIGQTVYSFNFGYLTIFSARIIKIIKNTTGINYIFSENCARNERFVYTSITETELYLKKLKEKQNERL